MVELSLYIHIPFCTKKCPYCHFYVVRDKEPFKDALLNALLLEWKAILPRVLQHKIVSIYFGGGTPTLFGPTRLRTLLSQIQNDASLTPDVEITIEANPETCTKSSLSELRSLGINRLSLGIQSFNDSHLALLGRTHSSEKAKRAAFDAQDAGFNNVTIDLMYELPYQTLKSWEETLAVATTLPITHLSLYNLTIEPHTAFAKKEAQLRPNLPSSDDCTRMYEMAIDRLQEAGLSQYEISAFCKPGFRSRHNIGYWTNRFFFGLGPSAFSYYGNSRFQNVANLTRYCTLIEANKSAIDFEEVLDQKKRKKEVLALGLRILDGVELNAVDAESEDAIKTLIAQELLEKKNNRICLTKRGIFFYDTVASEII